MARRKLENRLVNLTDINEELKPIENSNVDYITPSGKIYCYYGNNKYLPKTNTKNKYNGYLYVSLKHKDGYYVTGSVDKDGKITVGDTSTSKPAGNTNCPA